ncbi:MAG TPA: bile acid:sodium symporter family protein [Kiritimatiellia bacterium]|nr:bile acid:sodium symporter family protein [Kiritimatiellia bacterium]HMO99394.1 bile acid:sodium symporter family protein [Kiritimatiellia bacterium]HMP97736.1 bile acid:sodium symporter family protein [Kiritimatiellia bacterium]
MSDLLKTVVLPLALMIIMFGMGMTLKPVDFKRVILAPKAKLIGLFNQLVLLPVIAFGLVFLFRLSPELSVGLMLVAACPGGPTSNLITHLSRGDTALSVTLTAVSSVITVITIPLIVGFSLELFTAAGDTALTLPFGKTVGQLMIVTIIPISLGMWVHARWPGFARRMGKPVNVLSMLFLALVIVAAAAQEPDLAGQFREAGLAALSLNVITMALGFGIATAALLPTPQRISISIESGIQNGTLALAIALGLIGSPRIAVPAVVYSLLMFASGAFMILRFGRRAKNITMP